MGGKGGQSGPSQAEINQKAYAAGASGQKWNDVTNLVPYGHDQALESWMAGQQSVKHQPSLEDMLHGAMGGFHQAGSSSDSSTDLQATLDAQLEQQRQAEEERRRIEGENRRDQMYAAYLDAAGTATDYVNSEIDREAANARLLGIDYTIDDEMKNTRISDYFATVWGEGEHSQLEALMKEWGNPQGFEGFTITRGDASKYAPEEGEETTVGKSGGMRPGLGNVLEDEEQVLGGTTAILGE